MSKKYNPNNVYLSIGKIPINSQENIDCYKCTWKGNSYKITTSGKTTNYYCPVCKSMIGSKIEGFSKIEDLKKMLYYK